VLLLAATRRKDDFALGHLPPVLGHPAVSALIYLFFVSVIFAYGLILFQEALIRGLMLFIGLVPLAVTGLILRRGALVSRAAIQMCDDQRARGDA
jgi:hypothetical protein